jgi:acetyltransferase-like isoleucine patch superfamily enzyme
MQNFIISIFAIKRINYKMFRRIYLSPFGFFISLALNFLAQLKKPFMVYGFFNSKDKKFYKRTRIGSTVLWNNKNQIGIKDDVWIGQYCLLDGIGGIAIGAGVHIASHSCIYTHSSQDAIRWMGAAFIETPAEERTAYIIKGVEIGEYSFIGAGSVILPGTTIGKGCIIGAGSIVKGEFADFAVIAGNPAKVIDSTLNKDRNLFLSGLSLKNYFDPTIKF